MRVLKPIVPLLLAGFLAGCTTVSQYTLQPDAAPAQPPVSVQPKEPLSPPPSQVPLPTPTPPPYDYAQPVPENGEVDGEWFADAIFLGDSRTDGLRLYGGITEAEFICYKGLICQQFSTKACIDLNGTKVTAEEALRAKSCGKVFVMLGLNEMGFSPEAFAADYAVLIDTVKAAQPEADLYFQTVLPVNEQRRAEAGLASYFNNEKVAAFNAEIARLCEEKQVYLVNVSEGVCDETGQLPYDKTHDGVHLSKTWYQQWYAYLRTHTVDSEPTEVTP